MNIQENWETVTRTTGGEISSREHGVKPQYHETDCLSLLLFLTIKPKSLYLGKDFFLI